jgi:hypothetical protein
LQPNANVSCTLTNASGVVGSANVTNVGVTCQLTPPPTYTIGGTVSGLPAGTSVVLVDNDSDVLTVAANGTFTFGTPLTSFSAYSVTVQTTAGNITCSVNNGSGTVGSSDVTNVAVSCQPIPTYTIGGTVTGVSNSGASILLQDNGGDNVTVTADGSFTFPTALVSGSAYSVAVSGGGGLITCTVTNGSGTVGSANITNVGVSCKPVTVPTYTIGGTVTGLPATGASIVLQDNGKDSLTVTANGSFTFATGLTSGTAYTVSIQAIVGGVSCSVTNGTGTVSNANVTNVAVSCQLNSYTIGGTVTGLPASGASIVLQDNGKDSLTVTANGSFTFATPVASGSPYSVTASGGGGVVTCSVTNGSGTVASANVTGVAVTCQLLKYTVGGTVTGLSAAGGTVQLQNNGGDTLTITADSVFTFATSLASGSAYRVTAQPSAANVSCTVTNGSGTVSNANITNVAVTCKLNSYTIGGTVTGLPAGASIVLQDNGNDSLTVTANGSFTFATPVVSGGTYNVTAGGGGGVVSCTVGNATGTVGGANVTNVAVTCQLNSYSIGGTVTGLPASGASIVLQDNGKDALTVTANGSFTFATALTSGSTYTVSIQSTAGPVSCSVGNATGTVGVANVTNVAVTCQLNSYTIGGTVTGLPASGASIVLQDNGKDSLTISANGSFTFATPIVSGSTYTVTASGGGGIVSCTVGNATGTVGSANVTNVAVTCQLLKYTVGGTVTGLSAAGGTLQLQNNGGDTLTVTADSLFTFATALTSGSAYRVTAQPSASNVNCTVTNGTGTVGTANVTNVQVTCVGKFTIGGSVVGLNGTGASVVLKDNGVDQLTLSADGTFTFATPLATGSTWNVTWQPGTGFLGTLTCMITNATGTVASANVTYVGVNCQYSAVLSVLVSGLRSTLPTESSAASLLVENGNYTVTTKQNGTYRLGPQLPKGTSYNVVVGTQPGIQLSASPTTAPQTDIVCNAANASGVIVGDVVVKVQCVDRPVGWAYVTNGSDGTVSSYVIAADGTLVQFGNPVATGTDPTSVSGTGYYLASYLYVTNGGSNTLVPFTLDSNTGVPAVANVLSSITAGPSFVTTYGGDLYVTSTANIPGTPAGNGAVARYTLTSPVSPANQSDVATGGGPVSVAFAQPYDSSIPCNPVNYPYVYIANSKSNTISTYVVTGGTALGPVGNGSIGTGAGPSSLASVYFSEALAGGNSANVYYLYVANSTANIISSYAVNCSNGTLAQNTKTFPAITAPNQLASMTTLKGATYLYATSPAGVTGYAVPLTGVLGTPVAAATPVGTSPGPITTYVGTVPYSLVTVTSGSTTLTLPSVSPAPGDVVPGMFVTDNQNAFAAGTYVVSVSGQTVTLSAPPVASATNDNVQFVYSYVYAVDTSAGSITTLSVNPINGTLTQVGTPVPTGGSPTSIFVTSRTQIAN